MTIPGIKVDPLSCGVVGQGAWAYVGERPRARARKEERKTKMRGRRKDEGTGKELTGFGGAEDET